jgi:hypothetical protein
MECNTLYLPTIICVSFAATSTQIYFLNETYVTYAKSRYRLYKMLDIYWTGLEGMGNFFLSRGTADVLTYPMRIILRAMITMSNSKGYD